jgi:hypothetical protein
MAGLSDLDFLPGVDFQSQVLAHFSASVSLLSSSSSFSLVASFSYSATRLYVDSVLEAWLVISMFLGSRIGVSAFKFPTSLWAS